MPDRLDLPVRWRRQIEALLAEHVPKAEVWAYGSRVNGTSHDASDLDLVLRGPNLQRIPTDQLYDLVEAIEESNIPILIDIHDWSTIPDYFKPNIRDSYEVLVGGKTFFSPMACKNVKLGDAAMRVRELVMPRLVPNTPYIGLEHIAEQNLALMGLGSTADVSSAKARFCKGDILFGALRPYFRKVVMAPFDGVCSSDIWVLRANTGIDQGFLLYSVASQRFIKYVTSGSLGTRMPRAKWDYASQYELCLPPLGDQRRISKALGVLDDRIELNRRMAATLEAMAKALFKSWFVDFDPVRAKMEGRDTGLPDHIADFFPDRLVDSPLGPIPEGWQIRQIQEIARLVTGRSYRSSELAESRTALVTLKSFQRGGGYRDEGLKPYVGRYHPDQIIEAGEVVIACTDVSQAGDVIGRSAVVRESRQFDTKVASLDVMIVRPKERSVPRWFIHRLLSTGAFAAYASAYATGTTVLHLDKSSVPQYSFICPPQQLIDRVDSSLASIDQDVRNLYQQAEGIARLRDALLRWLMSNDSLVSV